MCLNENPPRSLCSTPDTYLRSKLSWIVSCIWPFCWVLELTQEVEKWCSKHLHNITIYGNSYWYKRVKRLKIITSGDENHLRGQAFAVMHVWESCALLWFIQSCITLCSQGRIHSWCSFMQEVTSITKPSIPVFYTPLFYPILSSCVHFNQPVMFTL